MHSFVRPSFVWVCIFFSTGQVLLSTLSWCCACTSMSDGVFLMYPWREIYSMSTYSSTILFSPKNWCIWTVCWRRLWRVPWTARRSKQPILKEINSEYSLEGLMLKLQYFGHLMWRTDSLEKTLMLGKIEGWRRGQQRMQWLHSITDSMDVNLSKLWETAEDRGAWRAVVHGVTKSWT